MAAKSAKTTKKKPAAKAPSRPAPARVAAPKPAAAPRPAASKGSGIVYSSALREMVAKRLGRG